MCAESFRLVARKLDPREEHFRIPSHHDGRSLFLRYMPPRGEGDHVVLYVHGGTFPSALSVAHRFDGRSWRDELCAAGFHRSGAPRTPVASSSRRSVSSLTAMGLRGSRLSPIRGEPS